MVNRAIKSIVLYSKLPPDLEFQGFPLLQVLFLNSKHRTRILPVHHVCFITPSVIFLKISSVTNLLGFFFLSYFRVILVSFARFLSLNYSGNGHGGSRISSQI